MTAPHRLALAALLGLCAPSVGGAAPVTLGSFTFDSALFGDTLLESDGGSFAAGNWMNVVNSNPGNPAYLTGANFGTGIANIGTSGARTYTIGYGTPILNGAGNDLGVVQVRFSPDPFDLTINGQTLSFGAGLAVSTGVIENFYYNSTFAGSATYYVTEIDLSDFGVAPGASVSSIAITGSSQLDLIRVAGYQPGDEVATPEPGALALLGAALFGLGAVRRKKASGSFL